LEQVRVDTAELMAEEVAGGKRGMDLALCCRPP